MSQHTAGQATESIASNVVEPITTKEVEPASELVCSDTESEYSEEPLDVSQHSEYTPSSVSDNSYNASPDKQELCELVQSETTESIKPVANPEVLETMIVQSKPRSTSECH